MATPRFKWAIPVQLNGFFRLGWEDHRGIGDQKWIRKRRRHEGGWHGRSENDNYVNMTCRRGPGQDCRGERAKSLPGPVGEGEGRGRGWWGGEGYGKNN